MELGNQLRACACLTFRSTSELLSRLRPWKKAGKGAKQEQQILREKLHPPVQSIIGMANLPVQESQGLLLVEVIPIKHSQDFARENQSKGWL